MVTSSSGSPPVLLPNILSSKSNSLIISANVIDDIKVKYVILRYKFEKLSEFTLKKMENFAANDYGIQLDVSKISTPDIWYYIEAYDYSNNKNGIGTEEEPLHAFIKSKDNIPPTIDYLSDLQKQNNNYYLETVVNDQVGVKKVNLVYGYKLISLNNVLECKQKNNNRYELSFSLTDKNIEKIYYRIEATDLNDNKKASPLKEISLITPGYYATTDTDKPEILRLFPPAIGLRPTNYERGNNIFYPFMIRVRDNVQVASVKLFYRNIGEINYQEYNLFKAALDSWQGLLEGADKGIEFYVLATDANNLEDQYASYQDPEQIPIFYDPDKIAPLPTSLRKYNERKERKN